MIQDVCCIIRLILINSPTDGLTCWAAGISILRGKKLKTITGLSGYNESEGAVSEPEQKPDNCRRKKKVEKCFML